MTDFSGPSVTALEFALDIRRRVADGEDFGDSLHVDEAWTYGEYGRTIIRLSVYGFDPETGSAAERVLGIRRAIGGTFEKNDPSVDAYANQYAILSQRREDFTVQISTNRANTCVQREVSVEVIEHPAAEAWTETKRVYEWDCAPLNRIAEGDEPEVEEVGA